MDSGAVAIALSPLPLRVLLAVATDLSPDEAYYAAAAMTGAFPPDHPPVVVLLAKLGLALPALPIEMRVRLVPVLLGLATALLLVRAVALSDTGTAASQRWAALLASWTILPMTGGFLLTPDSPAMLALACLLLLNRLPAPPRLLVALASVIGLASKVVLLPVVLASALYPVRENRWRLPALAASAVVAPIVAPSVAFQLHHAYRVHAWTIPGALGALLALAAAQGALWTPAPWVLGPAGLSTAPVLERAWVAATLLLVALSAIVRAVPPEPNWLAPAALVLIAASAAAIPRRSVHIRRTLLVLGPGLCLVAASHVVYPWLPLPRASDPTARLHGWRSPSPPSYAPGVGSYGAAAERCVYQRDCDEITSYFRGVGSRSSTK